MQIKCEIIELINKLNYASDEYYNNDNEIMTNKEYDALYDKLATLEKVTNIHYADSPTNKVGYEVKSELMKVKHDSKMLSLSKTKSIDELKEFLGDQVGLLSWKMDGLTVVLKYDKGELQQAITRGNGEVGEDITHNARVFSNLPLTIPFKGKLTLRGEAVISYSQFEKINAKILLEEDKYKNPRNLCSGTVRQLNSEICKSRNVKWYCFELVEIEELEFEAKNDQLFFCFNQGFETSDILFINDYLRDIKYKDLAYAIDYFTKGVKFNDIPVDGLVLTYNDIKYSNSLGSTSHHPLHSMAFKWKDECIETTLLDIEWETSRTGLINPVAIFEPVEIDGTEVARASLHNLSIIDGLELGIRDTITVYKANQIIPQIDDNLTRSNTLVIPSKCPSCDGDTKIITTNTSKVLTCTNNNCPSKILGKFVHFVSRDCMNIEGLSEATLKKFIDLGYIKKFVDIYKISSYKDEIIKLDGFGKRSYENLIKSIEKSKQITLPNFIKALGIEGVGKSVGKLICEHFNYDKLKLFGYDTNGSVMMLNKLINIKGIGRSIANSYMYYIVMMDKNDCELIELMDFEIPNKSSDSLVGKTFVITGTVNHFVNRNELKAKIESLGGKVTGSVTKNTDCLINNDSESNSSKNKTAKNLGVQIITEEEFIKMIGEK